mgnify:FL=1
MEKTRCNYATFSFDKNTQSHEQYAEKKQILEKGLSDIQRKAPDFGDKMISVNALYCKEHNLTACYYKNRVFIGFQNTKTKEISFRDKTNTLAACRDRDLSKLLVRLENGIENYSNYGKTNEMSRDVNRSWEKVHPTLDRLVGYENELEQMPESRQQIIKNSGLYEQEIGKIIDADQKELNPLIEQAWEEILGMDIGASGKRNTEAPMSTHEEDLLEKTYHRDLGSEGYVDEPWHEREHIEPVKARPLTERIAEAKKESMELKQGNEPGLMKMEQNEERELTSSFEP